MTRRFLVTLFVLLTLAGAAVGDTAPADAEKSLSVRTFQLKHKDADKTAAMIKQLMSAEGSVAIQPGTQSIVVTDRSENLKTVAAAITKYDVAPQLMELSVRIISAGRGEAPRLADELKDVGATLSALRYNVFDIVGSATVQGREGEQGIAEIGTGYRAEFRFGEYDPASDTIRVADFKLSRLQKEELTQVLKTSLNLKVGQVFIMGASRDPQSTRALMVVFSPKR
jgi:hypothetical protein